MKFYSKDFKEYSIKDLRIELAREQAMRAKHYPNFIQQGKLTRREAEKRYKLLRVLEYILYLCEARKLSIFDLLEAIGGPGEQPGEQKKLL